MGRICVVIVAGLDRSLLDKAQGLKTLAALTNRTHYRPAEPAVTCTSQATLTTGKDPREHGIIANGLFTHAHPELHAELDLDNHAESRRQVSFWEQSNGLLRALRFWANTGKRVAMLFMQNAMPSRVTGEKAADIVITPKPVHTPDGKTLTACWSDPGDLYSRLTEQLGPFPLHNYWSPVASLPSSHWIARAAERIWRGESDLVSPPDLQWVYIPHLDFNLQRLGPNHPAILKDLLDVDALLAPLAAQVRADGGTFIVLGDYGITEVHVPILPNLHLRRAGLLKTRPDQDGKLLVDYDGSAAFAMVDHQVAHIYVKEGMREQTAEVFARLPEDFHIITRHGEHPPRNPREGDLLLRARAYAWFAHDWWDSDAERPRWQFTVDIHNKPGFDPRELFFDPAKKHIAQDPALVKGSHGITDDAERWPVLLSDAPLPEGPMDATNIAPWLQLLL